jgi:hypothetical protein
MPGVGLIPAYEERLRTVGVGVTSQHFLEFGIYPTLRKLGVSRTDLVSARRKSAATSVVVDVEAAS